MPDDIDFVLSNADDSSTSVPEGDSGILEYQANQEGDLKFVKAGNRITVMIQRAHVSDVFSIAMCRDKVYEQLSDPDCTLVRFDLLGIPSLPSGMLGLLASVKNHGVDVEVVNTCQNIRDALGVTKLDMLVKICD